MKPDSLWMIDILPEFSVPEGTMDVLYGVAVLTLEQEGVRPPAGFSLLLTDDPYLQQLNRDFRGYDKPTDVLSFPAGQTLAQQNPGQQTPYLGDIAISVPTAQQQAHTAQHPLLDELRLLTVHGILHLLGYDHATPEEKAEMWAAQDKVLRVEGRG